MKPRPLLQQNQMDFRSNLKQNLTLLSAIRIIFRLRIAFSKLILVKNRKKLLVKFRFLKTNSSYSVVGFRVFWFVSTLRYDTCHISI